MIAFNVYLCFEGAQFAPGDVAFQDTEVNRRFVIAEGLGLRIFDLLPVPDGRDRSSYPLVTSSPVTPSKEVERCVWITAIRFVTGLQCFLPFWAQEKGIVSQSED